MSLKKGQLGAELMLVAVAIVWGGGFIATEYAINSKMPNTLILSIRFMLASLVMFIFSFKDILSVDKKTLFHGIIAGIFLFLGFFIQIVGQAQTTVSNAAFLTATNVVMVPFIVWGISKHRPRTKTFVLATTTLVGIGVLTLNFSSGLSFNIGDISVLLCSLMFAFHISYLGIFSPGLNTKVLTFLQLFTAGVIATLLFFITDYSEVTRTALVNGIIPTLYLAIFSTLFCYFFQTKCQQIVPPGRVGIILCTEGFFGSLFSILLGLEPLKATVIIGGIIIITSVMLSEIDISFKKKAK